MSDPTDAPITPPTRSSPTTNVDPQSVEGIFVEALAKPSGSERRAFLDVACQGQPQFRERVEALLRAYDDAGSFLQRPAGDWRNPPPAGAYEVDEQGIPRGLLHPSDRPGCVGTLGPYEVQEMIGRGGMGIVLRALDPKLNRIVAVKALAPELASQPAARRRFLREAQAAAAVSHPHVVTIHAVNDDQPPYLVMECIVGRSLQQKIDEAAPLKVTEILRIGTQAAEGLAAAHKQGLVHRDVKPANILLENGVERVKITDFGLARAADDVAITQPGELSGTPQYMSPEQALGQRVDQRSDLFSLGCVLYAMCTGRAPFRGDNWPAVIKQVCDAAPRPIGEVNPEIPDWLIATVERLLAKDPADRFQSAAEVAELLAAQLATTQAGQAPAAPVASRHAEPSAPRTEVPSQRVGAWLVLVGLAVTAYLVGRSLPLNGAAYFVAAALGGIGSAITFWWRDRESEMSSSLTVVLIFLGFAGWLAGMGFGAERHARYGSELVMADGLIGGLLAMVVGAAIWQSRRPSSRRRRDDRRETVPQAPFRAPNHPATAAAQPWKTAGWIVVILLSCFLLLPCLIGIGILLPAYQAAGSRQQPQAEMAVVTVRFDEEAPVIEFNRHSIDSNPCALRFYPSRYVANVTYLHEGQRFQFEQVIELAAKEHKTLDLAPAVREDIMRRSQGVEKGQKPSDKTP